VVLIFDNYMPYRTVLTVLGDEYRLRASRKYQQLKFE
jgi:hypothetical protein